MSNILMSFIKSHKHKSGFIESNGGVYYTYRDGSLAKGYTIINNKKYNFDNITGKMMVGLHTVSNGGTYYFLEGGDVYKGGMKIIEGKKYYFSKETGNMQVGIREVDDKGTKYYFLEDGDVYKGESRLVKEYVPYYDKYEEHIYYFDKTGKVCKIEEYKCTID